MLRGKVTLGLTVAFIAASPGAASAGDGTFSPEPGSPITGISGADSVAVGDFNNDGKQDVAVARTVAPNNVTILLGQGNGTFVNSGSFSGGPGGAGSGPEWVAVGDFNENGNQDLAIANTSSEQVAILLGVGDGTFAAPALIGVGTDPRSLAVGDLNNDQNEDLVVPNSGSASVSALLGAGDGTFGAPTTVGAASFPDGIGVGDFDEDGRDDAVIASYTGQEVGLYRGTNTGLALASSQVVVDQPVGVATGDFDRDGHLDAAVAGANSDDVTILRGDGHGDLSPTQGSPYPAGNFPQAVIAGEFEDDGRPDLAVTAYSSDNVTLLRGESSGAFAPEPGSPLSVGNNGPIGIAGGDFDGDGVEDLAVALFDLGGVAVLGGNGTPANPGNLLQNGRAEGTGPATTSAQSPDVPGWTDTGNLTYVRYGAPPTFPKLIPSLAWNGGSSFFSGGPSAASSATQTVDVSASAASIDAGLASATLSGLLGGFRFQNDRMKVTATFRAGNNSPLGTISIGPVTSGDRLGVTTFLPRTATGGLPTGTRSIEVRLDATRVTGTNSDGYADNLSLTLKAPAPPAKSEPPAADTTPPETTITGAPPRKTTRRRLTFSFEASEQATFECSVDRSDFAACSSPFESRKLGRRAHSFAVRATDSAGNVDQTPAKKGVKIKKA